MSSSMVNAIGIASVMDTSEKLLSEGEIMAIYKIVRNHSSK